MTRPLAPHVQAALARPLQAKLPQQLPAAPFAGAAGLPARPPAPHVQQALAATAQPQTAPPARPQAPLPSATRPPAPRPPASHVQQALAAAAQPQIAPPARPPAPHVAAAVQARFVPPAPPAAVPVPARTLQPAVPARPRAPLPPRPAVLQPCSMPDLRRKPFHEKLQGLRRERLLALGVRPGVMSLHHKISHYDLRTLALMAEGAISLGGEAGEAARAFVAVARRASVYTGGGHAARTVLDLLNNMPLNLELGPGAEKLEEETGTAFDPSTEASPPDPPVTTVAAAVAAAAATPPVATTTTTTTPVATATTPVAGRRRRLTLVSSQLLALYRLAAGADRRLTADQWRTATTALEAALSAYKVYEQEVDKIMYREEQWIFVPSTMTWVRRGGEDRGVEGGVSAAEGLAKQAEAARRHREDLRAKQRRDEARGREEKRDTEAVLAERKALERKLHRAMLEAPDELRRHYLPSMRRVMDVGSGLEKPKRNGKKPARGGKKPARGDIPRSREIIEEELRSLLMDLAALKGVRLELPPRKPAGAAAAAAAAPVAAVTATAA